MALPSDTPVVRALPHADWQPPYPAHSARFGSDVRTPVIAYFGCQSQRDAALSEPVAAIEAFLARGTRPDYCDRAFFTDRQGYLNELLVGHWLDETRYDAWLSDSGYQGWLDHQDRLRGDVGVWQETFCVPLDRLETIAGKPDYGLARAAINKGTEVREHAYFGSMRHRIPIASTDPLHGAAVDPSSGQPRATRGSMVRVTPPENLAVIRSGQDWTRCIGEELATYLSDVHPKLIEGMNYLRDHPEQTGCCACRFAVERDAGGGEATRSFGFAMFVSLRHLETWSKSHPTHLAIFNSFHRMIQKHKDARGLRLWHEVLVLGQPNRDFVYVNCHERTGLLPLHGGTGASGAQLRPPIR